MCCDEREASLRLAGSLLANLGIDRALVSRLCREDRVGSELQDVRLLEESMRNKRVNNQATFVSSSGYRFNSADSRSNLAKSFVDLAKSQLSSMLRWDGSPSSPEKDAGVGGAGDVLLLAEEEEDSVGESVYFVADKTLQYRDTSSLKQGVNSVVVGGSSSSGSGGRDLVGVDGVDYCKIPDADSKP